MVEMNNRFNMSRKHYIILIGLFIVFGIASVILNRYHCDWANAFTSNLSAGFLSALIIAWLIERSLSKQRENDFNRIRVTAFGQVRHQLLRHLGLLIDMYKAAENNPPKSIPKTFDELFNANFYDQIKYLDFSKHKQTTIFPITWFKEIEGSLVSLRNSITTMINKFAIYLDVDSIEYFENLSNSDLISYLLTICSANIQMVDQREGFKRQYTMLMVYDVNDHLDPIVENHITNCLLPLLNHYNKFSSQPITVNDLGLWRENSSPKFGSARVNEEKQ